MMEMFIETLDHTNSSFILLIEVTHRTDTQFLIISLFYNYYFSIIHYGHLRRFLFLIIEL